jgi:hypothetical protein
MALGYIEIAPVDELIDMPVGKAPEATAKVYEVFPPLAEAVVVDALLIGMVTSAGAEIDNAVEIETCVVVIEAVTVSPSTTIESSIVIMTISATVGSNDDLE